MELYFQEKRFSYEKKKTTLKALEAHIALMEQDGWRAYIEKENEDVFHYFVTFHKGRK